MESYTCAACGGRSKSRPDEEALAEAHELFGDMPKEELAVVCNDCWRKLMAT
jgi:hypothetical protein